MPKYQTQRPTDWARITRAYRSQILQESAILIRKEQDEIVDAWDLYESGTLKSSLRGHFTVTDIDTGSKLSMRYLTYFRFLDIPDVRRKLRNAKKEGYHSYNRVVFGYLYNQTLPQLKYGLTEETQTLIRNKLAEAMGGGTKTGSQKIFLLQDMAQGGDRVAQALMAKKSRQGYRNT